jgi:uncharacterized integral membrane protein
MLAGMAGSKSTSNRRQLFRGPDGPNWVRIGVAAAALIYAVIFILLNRDKVRVHFLFFTVATRLWVGFVVCLVLGALLGQGLGVYRRRSVKSDPPGRKEAA